MITKKNFETATRGDLICTIIRLHRANNSLTKKLNMVRNHLDRLDKIVVLN